MFGRYVKSLCALQSYLPHISPLNIASCWCKDTLSNSIDKVWLNLPRAVRLVGGLVSCENRFCLHKWTDGRGKQVLPSQMNGRTGTTLKNSFWVKAFLGGTRWLREGNRNLLRLLTILERMTNNNRVGSNVDLFCKLYYNFDQNGPGQGWFDPVLLPLFSFSLLLFLFF